MRSLRTLWLGLALFAGCGPRVVHRPLELQVAGLTSRAMRLVVLFFPGAESPGCRAVTLQTVASLEAPARAEWRRDAGADRVLSFPEVDDGEVMVAAYSADDEGNVLQVGCLDVVYADLESPEVTMALSRWTGRD